MERINSRFNSVFVLHSRRDGLSSMLSLRLQTEFNRLCKFSGGDVSVRYWFGACARNCYEVSPERLAG
jgi:hypothetical protein